MLTWRNERSSATMIDTKDEIQHIIDMMHKHEDECVLVEQLQSMLNDARQRLRRQQYDEYFSSRK